MINAEYSDQKHIHASQRNFTSEAYPETSLLQAQRRYSIFGSAGLDLTSGISVFLDGLYSHRSATRNVFWGSAPEIDTTKTPSWNLTGGIKASLFSDWIITGTVSAGKSKNSLYTVYPTSPESSFDASYNNSLLSFEGVASGTLLTALGGNIRSAIGGGYREENFKYSGDSINEKRNVKYIFGEIYIPILSPSVTRTGLQELDVSASARVEDYSDFGTSTNPKLGIRYIPFNGFTIRGTWGKSFKAPTMFDLYIPVDTFLVDATYFGGQDGQTVIRPSGGNSNLKPERAQSWTAGVEFNPQSMPSLKLGVTYFSIDYKDRVAAPLVGFSLLYNPLFAPFIEYNPSTASQQDVINSADNFINITGNPYDPASVIAILNGVRTNVASQKISGIDFSYSQTIKTSFGTIEPFANLSWLTIKQRAIPTASEQILTGLVDNPPSFKARFGATVTYGGISVSGVANHINGLVDESVTPTVRIPSYTTIDLNIAWKVASSSSIFRDVKMSLAVSNLFDRDPPIVESLSRFYSGIKYDSSNHSAIGRFITFSLSKAW